MNHDKNREADRNKDLREGEKNLGPHGNMRPDRFPESSMTKDQRKDTETGKEPNIRNEKDDSDIENLATDVNTVGSRTTSSDPSDIAGVADLDRGMKRSRKR